MDSKEFYARYLEPAFRQKRQRAEELAGQAEESLARVWVRIQERLKSGDLPEEPEKPAGPAPRKLPNRAYRPMQAPASSVVLGDYI